MVIPYFPLSPTHDRQNHPSATRPHPDADRGDRKIALTDDPSVVKLVAARCTETESGGRMIDAILTNTMLPAISHELLSKMMAMASQGESRQHGVGQDRVDHPAAALNFGAARGDQGRDGRIIGQRDLARLLDPLLGAA